MSCAWTCDRSVDTVSLYMNRGTRDSRFCLTDPVLLEAVLGAEIATTDSKLHTGWTL